jgi:hypothetical protein
MVSQMTQFVVLKDPIPNNLSDIVMVCELDST